MGRLEDMKKAIAARPPVAAKPKPVPPLKPVGGVIQLPGVKSPPSNKPKRGGKPNDPNAVKTPPSPPLKPKLIYKYLRLPDKSQKILTWDEEKYQWNGTLTVPGIDKMFEFHHHTEVGCFRGLHRRFEQWMLKHRPDDRVFFVPRPKPKPDEKPPRIPVQTLTEARELAKTMEPVPESATVDINAAPMG